MHLELDFFPQFIINILFGFDSEKIKFCLEGWPNTGLIID